MGEVVVVAAVVLLITFGAPAAAGLPLLTALVAVGISLSSIIALGNACSPPAAGTTAQPLRADAAAVARPMPLDAPGRPARRVVVQNVLDV